MNGHWRAFGCLFFLLHQGKLLWLLNAPVIGRWFRYVLRISGESSAVGSLKIDRILPNAIFWWQGDKRVAEFRTHAKFSKRLYYAFRPLWWAMHGWDWCIADRWVPELSFGFDTLTKYPDAHPETNTVDGYTEHSGTDITWVALYGGAGTAADDVTSPINGCVWLEAGLTSGWKGMDRGVFLFDTSALTSAANISAATESLYGSGSDSNGAGWTSSVNIYSSAPASNTALAAGDFDSFGTTAFSDTSIDYALWSAAGYNNFAFNASGIAAISKTGITKTGTRSNHDASNTAPTWGSEYSLVLNCYGAENTGTANDPKLVVTYSIAAREGELIGITDSVVYSLFQGGTAFTRAIADALGMSDAQYRVIAYGRKLTESIGLTDAAWVVKSMIRYISDVEGLTDSARRAQTFRRFLSDVEGLTDSSWRGVSWRRYFSDPLGITDAEFLAKGQQRILSDALGIADAANRYFTAKRYPADSVGITDAFSRRQDFARQLADALGITDEEARRAVFSRQATEALGITDTNSALKLLLRTISEQLGITDEELWRRGFGRIFADTLGFTDAQNRASALARGLTDALGITDQAARAVAFSRRMTEALGIGDYQGALKLLIRSLAESLGITDAQARTLALSRILSEAMGLTDARTRTMALGRILADAEGISDATSRTANFARTLGDALGITDQEWIRRTIARAVADAVGITDYRDVTKSAPMILRNIADGLSIADAIAVSKFAVIVRTISENLGITDARFAARAVRRILSEALGITDFEDETKQIRRYLSEIVGLADDVEKAALIIRRLTETAGITDAAVAGLAAYIVRIIADQVGLTDRVSKLAAILTWLALAIAVEIPAVDVELAGRAVTVEVSKAIREELAKATVDTEVGEPAIKTEVE